MNKKGIVSLALVLALTVPLAACFGGRSQTTNTVAPSPVTNESGNQSSTAADTRQSADIALKGNSIVLEGSGAVVDGSRITITSAGTYTISGTLGDGQIVVNTEDKKTVEIVLNGVDIGCSASAPIYVVNAEKTVITLADGSKNRVTDGKSYVHRDATSDEPNAAIFSNDDLTVGGSGSLTISANHNNGIQSQDDLRITGGNITVNAVNDGIKGRDSIAVKGGTITVNAGGDGMQSNNDEDSEKGFISIEGGTFNITAGADGIQAETNLTISGGNITVSSGGGSVNSSSSNVASGDIRGSWGTIPNSGASAASAKGLKAGVNITISAGTIKIDSSDDSIHSNDSITINGGNITIASGDDGIHSDSTVEVDGGDLFIAKCYEGIESAVVTVDDGTIHIVASDDGINVVGGADGPPMMGRPGQNMPGQQGFNLSGNNHLHINGGYIAVYAVGDGFDVNGSITMTGGTVIINGPTAYNNGALDYYGTFKITGGFLVAVGSSGMPQAPSTSSTQYSVMLNLPSSQPANALIRIETEKGEEILTFLPTKAYQSVVLCSPKLRNGSAYVVYTGGSSTGIATDGLYSGGDYAVGTQTTSFATSGMVTTVGSAAGGFPGGPGGRVVPGAGRR